MKPLYASVLILNLALGAHASEPPGSTTVSGTTPPAAGAGESASPPEAAAPVGETLQRVSSFLGKDVVNLKGEHLGEISDMLIDLHAGRLAYMVLSSGGFMRVGEKLFAIPLEAIQPQPGGDRWVLNIDKERLQNAPTFEPNQWPDSADRQWGTQVHQYYGVMPYWEAPDGSASAPGTEPSPSGSSEADSPRSGEPLSP